MITTNKVVVVFFVLLGDLVQLMRKLVFGRVDLITSGVFVDEFFQRHFLVIMVVDGIANRMRLGDLGNAVADGSC